MERREIQCGTALEQSHSAVAALSHQAFDLKRELNINGASSLFDLFLILKDSSFWCKYGVAATL